ncbi:MAG: GNAT family N-acetyltransferase [Bacteroidota bacterium]
MAIEIKEVVSSSDIKTFAKFPFEIYKNASFWVPPIIKDEMKMLMPEKNPAFDFCKAKFWLAFKDGKCVGRIGAIINELYNEKMNEKLGRFSRAEFIDDFEVSSKLFITAEEWVKKQGMTGIHGPLGFTNLDLQGLLIEGFDYMPSIGSVYHHPYYLSHFEKAGYIKEIDWIEFRLEQEDNIPPKALKLRDIIKKRAGVEVLNFTKSSELVPFKKDIFKLLNKAFAELHYVTSFNDKLIEYYSDKYFTLLNPKFVKIIINQEKEVVAFIIALPSLSEAMIKANGKVFPFGIFHILKAMKHPKVVDLLLTGVEPQLQSQGISALLITELQQTMIDHGVRYVETTGIFEDNHKAIQYWKEYNHIQHKRRRCFRKEF